MRLFKSCKVVIMIVSFLTASVFSGEVGYHTVYSNTSANTNRNAVPVEMPENGYIESISIYHGDVSNGEMQLAVYADASNAPGTKLAATAETSINTSEGWQTIDLTSPEYVASGTKIWLVWMFEEIPQAHWGNVSGSQGYVRDDLSSWSDSVDNMPQTWENVRPVPNVNFSIFATYTTSSGTYTLTVNSSGDGTVDRDPFKSSYSYGESITLTANPGDGSEFISWSGDLNGTTNPVTFNIDRNMTVNATFSEVPTSPQDLFWDWAGNPPLTHINNTNYGSIGINMIPTGDARLEVNSSIKLLEPGDPNTKTTLNPNEIKVSSGLYSTSRSTSISSEKVLLQTTTAQTSIDVGNVYLSSVGPHNNQGRRTSCLIHPSQIPAYGFPVPGSSELFTLALVQFSVYSKIQRFHPLVSSLLPAWVF